MLRIRLSRFGTKKRPSYRLVVVERTKDALGDVLEYLGSYNPKSNPKFIQLDTEKIKHWISQGAQPTATVHNLLVSEGIVEDKKVKAWRPKKKKKTADSTDKKTTDGADKTDKLIEEASKEEVKVEEKAEEKIEEPKVEEPKKENTSAEEEKK